MEPSPNRDYEPPTLTVLGGVTDLTLTGGQATFDDDPFLQDNFGGS